MILHCMEMLQFMNPFITDEHLASFRLRAFVSKAAMDILVHVVFGACVHISDGYKPWSGNVTSMYAQL